MKFLDLNGVSILWRRIKETFARKGETVSDISRDDTTFTVTRADGTTFEFTQKDTTYDVATTAISGLMSAIDKSKLNSIESSAQENIIESVSVNGTAQPISNKGIDITVPTAISDLANDVGYLTEESDPTVPAWAKQPQKPAYTASEVGALPADTYIPEKVSDLVDDSGHYTKPSGGIPSTDLAGDILTVLEKANTVVQDVSNVQDAVAGLTERLNTLADSDDTTLDQLSEIVVYIKNNKSLIDGITTGKVSVDDIVDNLTSTATNKPLSAKQGKALKDLIDGIVVPTKVSQLTNDAGYLTGHQDISGKQDVITDLATIRSGASLGTTALQEETDPTVPAWAKSSTKPIYTAAEVGALPDDTVIPSKVSELTNDVGYLTQHQDISGKADTVDLSAVATSGSYNDLTDKPTIPILPTNVSAFNNDAGYLTQHQDISGKANTADLATVATSGSYMDLANKPSIPTVPTNVSAFTNDSSYTNEQYVDNAITAALADVVGIEYHVCTADEYDAQTYLPTLAGEVGVIYLVPKPASLIGTAETGTAEVSGNNIYYEFIYNGRSFEMIGDTQVSLDGYLEDSDVSTDAQVQSVITEVFGGA